MLKLGTKFKVSVKEVNKSAVISRNISTKTDCF